MDKKKLILLAVAGIACSRMQAQTIPLDPAVRTGKLANGFTYYIRHNEEPKKRVELYLVNKVGSVLEDDDQQGLAHFMEHMNFNGTKNFPKNELVDFLQRAGVRFGADLNAYTSFDETVYQLPIPIDNPDMFGNGIKIMRDWAQEATLDPSEIDQERGVVLEEERLGKGAKDRMSRQYLPMLLNHTRYADRLPIGKDTVLKYFKPGVIKRFHHDWYRPDLQALIIVGDIDVNEAEKLVKEKFSDLKNPPGERERTAYAIPLTGKSQFMTVTDKEETSTDLEVMLKHNADPLVTESGYITQIKKSLLNQLISSRRYAELSREKDPAYTGMSLGVSSLLNNIDMLGFSVSARDGKLEQAFRQTWLILEKIKRHGFTPGELDRARQNYLRSLQTGLNEQGKTPSISYVKEYQNLFLHGEASPGIAWEYQFSKNHIAGISLDDINSLMKAYLQSRDIDVLVSAPEKDRASLPDSATVQRWITAVNQQDIPAFKDEQVNQSLLTARPKAGKVIKKQEEPQIGIVKLTLSNGIKVILKPTDFKNDQVLYGAFCPGGTSLYDDVDYDVASNAGGLMANMGIGHFDPVQLNQWFTGKVASSSTGIGLRSQTVRAGAAPQDLEAALQLTYLQFTAPRKDSLLFRNTMNNAIAGLTNRYADPNKVFADTMSYVQGDYNYRYAAPTADRLGKITLDRAYDIYKERFADASGFTFVFVGNFKQETLIPLLEIYLGSLPSLHQNVQARDLGIHVPPGRFTKKVHKGAENKATVRMMLTGKYEYGTINNLQLKALADILQIKVLQQLREKESEVYSPQVSSVFNKFPEARFMINVIFGCAPKNAEHLIAMVNQEIAALKTEGPAADDIEKFKAAYEKNVELSLKDNSFWLNFLLSEYENKEDPAQVTQLIPNLDKVDTASVKAAAQIFLSGENVINFELLPENM
jgi:zinc protease